MQWASNGNGTVDLASTFRSTGVDHEYCLKLVIMKYVAEWSSEIIIINQFIIDFFGDGREGLLSIILQHQRILLLL
jgi:hypothetical protein